MNKFMQLAIEEARDGINHNHGGPFGSVIVKDNKIISKAHNMVLHDNDPTCHSEVLAIRRAGQNLKNFDLSGCDIYITGEPCPMCLGACLWANINKIYYGCTLEDNEYIGFRDNKFDKLFGGRDKLKDYIQCIDRDECFKLFEEYKKMNRQLY